MEELTQEMREQIARDMAKSQFVDVLIPMFEREWANGTTEFRLVLQDEAKAFYIHPLNKSGETVNLDWKPIRPVVESSE